MQAHSQLQHTMHSSRRMVSMGAPHTACLVPPGPSSCLRLRRLNVTCMAHPRRVAKVASQIKREVSEMFIYDKVVQEAICPERRKGLDDQLSAVASITEVYVSGDLQVAKVYVSVYSDEQGKERAFANLRRVAPYVRSRIGAAMGLRLTPEVRFIEDNSLDEFEQLQEAIGREEFERLAAEAEAEAGGVPSSGGGSSQSAAAAAAAAAAEAAAGFSKEDLDGDAGFFDMGADDDDTPAAAAAGPGSAGIAGDGELTAAAAAAAADGGEQQAGAQRPQVDWSRHDPNTFFEVAEDDLEEAESTWYSRRGPFDDMFRGSATAEVVQQRRQRSSTQGGPSRGDGRGGRGGRRQQGSSGRGNAGQ